MLTRKDRYKIRLAERYGAEILVDLVNMATGNTTLQAVADKHGFTREYARLIFKNSFGFGYGVVVKIREEKHKEEADRKAVLKKDPRHKLQNYKPGSLAQKGAVAEAKALEICTALGYDVRPFKESQTVDLVVNGYNVEVKSAYKTMLTNPKSKTPLFRFKLTESQRGIVDFVACYAVSLDKFFIIPISDYPDANNLYIPAIEHREWETGSGPRRVCDNKYYKFLDAWHLLRAKTQEVAFSSPSTASLTATTPEDREDISPIAGTLEGRQEEDRSPLRDAIVPTLAASPTVSPAPVSS